MASVEEYIYIQLVSYYHDVTEPTESVLYMTCTIDYRDKHFNSKYIYEHIMNHENIYKRSQISLRDEHEPGPAR